MKDGTYCIGFGYGGQLTDPRASEYIISTFKEFIKPGAEVKAYLTHDWVNDSLAKGVWSCWGPNAMSRWLEELQKPAGRIHFASADWVDGLLTVQLREGWSRAGQLSNCWNNNRQAPGCENGLDLLDICDTYHSRCSFISINTTLSSLYKLLVLFSFNFDVSYS